MSDTDTVFSPVYRNIRLHGKIPRVDYLPVSYPLMLRDAILVRVKAMSYFANGFTFSTNKMMQIQPQSLPFCGVYFIQETGGPTAEPQTGITGFATTVRIGFSVIILNNDGEAAENELDRAAQVLAYGLFRDSSLRNNSQFKVQAFTGLTRQHIFGNVGQNNETPVAELRWEIICDLGTISYEPVVPDMLEVIHVETEYPYGSDAPHIESEYDLEQ